MTRHGKRCLNKAQTPVKLKMLVYALFSDTSTRSNVNRYRSIADIFQACNRMRNAVAM